MAWFVQVAVAEEKAKAVQEELNTVLRDKARLAEDNLNAHRMLEVVRQTNKQQVRIRVNFLGTPADQQQQCRSQVMSKLSMA